MYTLNSTTVTTKGIELNRAELDRLVAELDTKEQAAKLMEAEAKRVAEMPKVGDIRIGVASGDPYVVMSRSQLQRNLAHITTDLVAVRVEASTAERIGSVFGVNNTGDYQHTKKSDRPSAIRK